MSIAPKVLSFAEARACVERHAAEIQPMPSEKVELLPAAGRNLAEDISADRDLPSFPRATRDGYAVRSDDLSETPTELKIMGQVKAGEVWSGATMERGQCLEIMTGAPVPQGADAVVMVEYTQVLGDIVRIDRGVSGGENVVPTGSEARQGQVVLKRGTRLGPAQVGMAAAVGRDKIKVYRRPRVAILSTGDEVVDIAAKPEIQQVRNSNSYALAAQVLGAGGDPVQLPIAPDDLSRLESLIREGLEADLLLLSGGVSMGKYDLVEQVLEKLGAEFFFTGALIQPGRPIVFGRARTGKKIYFFGLPGNPVSTLVTFELFAGCLVAALAGGVRSLSYASAKLMQPVKTRPGLTRFLPAVLKGEMLEPVVEVVPWQGSGDMAATAGANCYLIVPPDRPEMAAGEPASVLLPGGG
ncbi:MAG TPA: gephyrin-like molybdotransferase Glp [Terriglobales bacterium]|nr:gephyrin-like molybdotransferase Glp [Terriglobales bacterium]